MTYQPQADAVEVMFSQGYEVHEVTGRSITEAMLEKWLAERVRAGMTHHHAIRDCCDGVGWCEARYALENTLTQMHAALPALVREFPAFADEPTGKGNS